MHLVLTGLIVLWCLGLAMHAWAPSPKYLWYARATLGIGQSAVYASLSRMAQSWFPPPIRTTLQGMAGITAGRLGGLCANVLFGSLLLGLLGLDWRTAIYVFAVGGPGVRRRLRPRCFAIRRASIRWSTTPKPP